LFPTHITAEQDMNEERLLLYKKTSAVTSIPWYYLAAMDQYERNIQSNEDKKEVISIQFDEHLWYGPGNISSTTSLSMIAFFQGIGKDVNVDGTADINNEEARLYTASELLGERGVTDENIKISVCDYHQRDLTVKSFMKIAKVYGKMQKI